MRGQWTAHRALAVAVGGAAGAGARWAVVNAVSSAGFPWPVFALNVVGSVVLGILLAEEWSHPRARLLLHDFGGIGFCGGLTTFSTFAVEVVNLTRDGDANTAILYAFASVVATIAGVLSGAAALRSVRAVTLPLEGEP